MRFLVSCVKQTTLFVLMASLSLGFLFFVHFCYSTTLSLSSWQLTQESYHLAAAKDKQQQLSQWQGVGYNDTTGLVWFLHVTDLHISKFRSPDRTRDLRGLCQFIKESLRPRVVVVTGDLTDAKVSSSSFLMHFPMTNSISDKTNTRTI